jgi:RNA polymerase sigma factor (TIGR02999 family)
LRKIAQGYMRRERPTQTLQATALINEAYLRIYQGRPFQWKSRKHLFCVMANTMRRILVDHARNHRAHKREGEHQKLPLDAALLIPEEKWPQLPALDEAIERLAKLDPKLGHVVDVRFFAGLTVEETAAVLGMSPEAVDLDCRFAKAWLQRDICKSI